MNYIIAFISILGAIACIMGAVACLFTAAIEHMRRCELPDLGE